MESITDFFKINVKPRLIILINQDQIISNSIRSRSVFVALLNV